MILPYDKRLKSNARVLRGNKTDAEQKLWNRLRRKQINGWQFYRQKPLGTYIVDFYCAAANLVVELDGSQHFKPEHQLKDQQRDAYLAALGLRVLRFDNRQVLLETDAVVEYISRIPPSPPFTKGGAGSLAGNEAIADSEQALPETNATPSNPSPPQTTTTPPFEKGGLGGISPSKSGNQQEQS